MEKEEDKSSFLSKVITDEIGGKNAAIHAYDKMMWTVRSGYLTLVFGGWALIIKSVVEKEEIVLSEIKPFVFLFAGFSLVLSAGAYLIDRNYGRRKFRVIYAVNKLVELMMTIKLEEISTDSKSELTRLLQISGDAANKDYESNAFTNEITVSRIIYLLPAMLVVIIMIYCQLKF